MSSTLKKVRRPDYNDSMEILKFPIRNNTKKTKWKDHQVL